MSESFIWRDAGRVIVFEEGGVARALGLLRNNGLSSFELLCSARGLPEVAALAEAAAAVREIPPGPVPETAAALLDIARGRALVAYGGGRVIDTAKALASVTGASVVAIPTTMSGAEMTGIHRLPAGAEERARGLVRPQLVIADPHAMTGQPEPALRASSMNALAHGADSLYTPFANPVSRMTALRGARLIAAALDQERSTREQASLALGSVLCGYAIDSGMFAIHHVICQTLVRVCGAPHGFANAAILPRAMAYMAPRAPEQMSAFAAAIGTEVGELEPRILGLGGDPPGLGEVGADRSRLPQALDGILARPELQFTPGAPDRAQLQELIERAW